MSVETSVDSGDGASPAQRDALHGLRILVCVANYGTGNDHHLRKLLDAYDALPCETSIVLLTNTPKAFGPNVVTRLLPAPSDPSALPFEHLRVLAGHAEDYDLFVYTEDDTLLTGAHLRAFLAASAQLAADEVPGFLRYEESPHGEVFISTVHAHYDWNLDSVRRCREYVFAEYSNCHSGCYVLTRQHLRRALRSGNYVSEAYSGAYNILESAATHPFTRCGLRKLHPVSHLDEFTLHHLADKYLGSMGTPRELVRAQTGALAEMADGQRPRERLLEGRTKLPTHVLDRPWFDAGRSPWAFDNTQLLGLLPGGAGAALSVGATTGALERGLLELGYAVTTVPTDSLAQAVLEREPRLRVLAPSFAAAAALEAGSFEGLLLPHVLPYLDEPAARLRELARLVRPGGWVALTAPHLGPWTRRLRRGNAPVATRAVLQDFARSGIHLTTARTLTRWLRGAGCTPERVVHSLRGRSARVQRFAGTPLARFLAPSLVMIARRAPGKGAA